MWDTKVRLAGHRSASCGTQKCVSRDTEVRLAGHRSVSVAYLTLNSALHILFIVRPEKEAILSLTQEKNCALVRMIFIVNLNESGAQAEAVRSST